MNNDLEQFSENMLEKMAVGDIYPTVLEQAALARIALAAKQDKPVVVFDIQHGRTDGNLFALTLTKAGHELKSDTYVLYTTPQPAHTEQEGQGEIHQFIINNHEKDGYIEWADCNQEYFDSVSKDHRRVLYTTQKVLLEDKEGWRFVPEEATLSMLTMLGMTGSFESMQRKYKNMLSATPKPESE